MACLPLHRFLPIGHGLTSMLGCSAAILGAHFPEMSTHPSGTAALLTGPVFSLGSVSLTSLGPLSTVTQGDGCSDHTTPLLKILRSPLCSRANSKPFGTPHGIFGKLSSIVSQQRGLPNIQNCSWFPECLQAVLSSSPWVTSFCLLSPAS